MISKLLNILERGVRVMRSNTRLLFVGVLVLVFPVIFVLLAQSFFDTAYANIETSDKRRVGLLHDSLAIMVQNKTLTSDELVNLIATQASQNPDITEIRIVKKTPEGLLITQSLDGERIGTYEPQEDIYQSALGVVNNSLIFPFVVNGARAWQAVRSVTNQDGEQYFVFSEHSFAEIDNVMIKRMQQSYYGLTAIFLFLMGLAYWFAKQIDWRKRHDILETQLKERDLFTNMIAHEFRTPLTAINGYSSFLAESKNTSDDERRYVSNIQVSTARLLALVNDFLEVARIQSGKLSLELVKTDIPQVLAGVVDTLQQNAQEKRLKLSLAPPSAPVFHVTDSKRLHQVIQNLVSNSIKYTETGSVEITCEQTPVATVVRIKDTGMGISAEDQQKLFAPFARVGGVEKTTITGSGLGMWITKQLVEALGGTISVESIKNVGTHVVVTLKR